MPGLTPRAPEEIDESLHQACIFAVERCLCAFTNPGMCHCSGSPKSFPFAALVYVEWDYKKYCEDCAHRHLSNGGNSAKEEALRNEWEPKHRGTMRIRRAATVVDLQGRIIGWVLPEILPLYYQVWGIANDSCLIVYSSYIKPSQNQLHTAVKAIEADLRQRLAKATPQDSWRLSADWFGESSSYISSGLFNISAGWYPPGRTVSRYLFPPRSGSTCLSVQTPSTSIDTVTQV